MATSSPGCEPPARPRLLPVVIEGRARGKLFDPIADQYDRARPGYPSALFDDLADITGLRGPAHAVEIGCGTGQASRDLLLRGWEVTAVEPGEAMAAIARRHFASQPFALEPATFEAWDPGGRTFDLAFSATAFHWVDPAIRWAKAASVLRPAGHLALVTNYTVRGGTFSELYAAASALHAKYAWATDEGPPPTEAEVVAALSAAAPDIGSVWGIAEPKAGATEAGASFAPPVVRCYPWEQRYTAPEAVALLSTYSLYLALPPDHREPLLAGIQALIDEQFAGEVTRLYVSVLAVAQVHRRRPQSQISRL